MKEKKEKKSKQDKMSEALDNAGRPKDEGQRLTGGKEFHSMPASMQETMKGGTRGKND